MLTHCFVVTQETDDIRGSGDQLMITDFSNEQQSATKKIN